MTMSKGGHLIGIYIRVDILGWIYNEYFEGGHLIGIINTNGRNVDDIIHLDRGELIGVVKVFGHIAKLPDTHMA